MPVLADNLPSSVLDRVRGSQQRQRIGDFWRITCRAMSTCVRIDFVAARPVLADDFQRDAVEWIARFESRYSRFLADSIVGQINARAGGDWTEFDDEAEQLFATCDRMHALSRGTFDPAALPLLKLWDWKSESPTAPDPSAIRAARHLSGWDKVQRRPGAVRLPVFGMGIDLGGIGKEYAVDRLIHMARQYGINDVLVDIGHDLRASGRPPGRDAWYIGLEEPDRPGHCWTVVRLTDQAVATSGDYRRVSVRGGKRVGHIINPRTGEPVSNGCQAVSVIAPNCTLAGVLSTAAFILEPTQGLDLIQEHGGGEGCITTENARHQTRRFSSYVPI